MYTIHPAADPYNLELIETLVSGTGTWGQALNGLFQVEFCFRNNFRGQHTFWIQVLSVWPPTLLLATSARLTSLGLFSP